MSFELDKRNALNKADKSSKGNWDKPILYLLDKINEMENYYTTSSCSGRILLIKLGNEKRKLSSGFMFSSHDFVQAEAIISALKKPPKEEVWFKMESMILHVCCRTIEDAGRLLEKVRSAGFKHSGINSMGSRIIIEVIGNEKIETIVARERRMLVDEDYVRELVEIANEKLAKTHEMIKALIIAHF